MAAYISNIVIDAGADFDQVFNLEDSANSPLDLTGYSAISKLKKHPASLTTFNFIKIISRFSFNQS